MPARIDKQKCEQIRVLKTTSERDKGKGKYALVMGAMDVSDAKTVSSRGGSDGCMRCKAHDLITLRKEMQGLWTSVDAVCEGRTMKRTQANNLRTDVRCQQ